VSRVQAPTDSPPTRGAFTRQAFRAHRDWVKNGRTGEGRFDVAGIAARSMNLEGMLVVAGLLERIDLDGAELSRSSWNDSTFTRCQLTRARTTETVLEGAALIDCDFTESIGRRLNIKAARVTGCTFDRGTYSLSRWHRTTVMASTFRGAALLNARLVDATFRDCDFTDALLGLGDPMPEPSLAGTVFERCDFTGADFHGAVLDRAVFRDCVAAPLPT
jgi:uncharacterized protein YjbI with pentapeptide repeats